MDETKIVEALERNNLWWKETFALKFKPREIYNNIQKFLAKRQILALVGLRRTGKTTIMFKLIEDALKMMERSDIVYFSFDDFKDLRLFDVVKSYERLMRKDTRKGKYLFLFDEIQKIDNWEEQIKRLYDENPQIKIVISGSESLFIRKKSRESLAGRIYEFHVKILNFREYLLFKEKKLDNISLHREEILREFKNFLISNGFPEIITEDKESAAKYIKENVIERVIYKDIPQIVPVGDPSLLEALFRILLEDPGEIVNLDDLGSELGMTRQTVSVYLEYLEKSFLIRKLYNYSKNPRKTYRRAKKYYPTIITPDILDKRELFGKIFETVLVNQLNAEFFWRDSFKNEVDVIQLEPFSAIEVKSGDIKERNLLSLQRFTKKFKPKQSFVLSYDMKKKINGIDIIPFYEYLLK
ncbi:ATP-binding protein [Candidatus Pacearchaeota archaeon]|nr:ATP-binding protein [Candidatus Pacearchaeota archaeon]